MQTSPNICDEKIYNEFYISQAKKLRNYLYYKYGDLNKAEDITQESFLRIWSKCSEIIFNKAVGLLYTISNNLAIDTIRSKKTALKFEKQIQLNIDNEDPYFVLRTKEFQEKIESVISDLPEKQREAFLLNRIDKLTFKEIAILLKVSETTIENRISKALLKLKKITELELYKI